MERTGWEAEPGGRQEAGRCWKQPDRESGSISIMATSQARLFTSESMPIARRTKSLEDRSLAACPGAASRIPHGAALAGALELLGSPYGNGSPSHFYLPPSILRAGVQSDSGQGRFRRSLACCVGGRVDTCRAVLPTGENPHSALLDTGVKDLPG